MPFAIVQTTSARGRKELSVVPDKWLDTSIQGDILLWPNVKSSTEQAKLQRDEKSTPGRSWLKYKCKIKRKNMPSYAQAAEMIDEMSGCSSSDVSMAPRKRKKINQTAPVNFQSMLNLPSPQPTITPHPDVPPKVTTASPVDNQNAPNMITVESRPAFQSCPKKASEQVILANVTVPTLPQPSGQTPAQCSASQPNTTAPAPQTTPIPTPIVVPAASDFNQSYFEFDPNMDLPGTVTFVGNPKSTSENSIQQCVDYLKQLIDMQKTSDALIEARISSLEKRMAHQSTQLEFIMDAIRCRSGEDGTVVGGLSFTFEPIDDARKLEDFEKTLGNEAFRSNLVSIIITCSNSFN